MEWKKSIFSLVDNIARVCYTPVLQMIMLLFYRRKKNIENKVVFKGIRIFFCGTGV
jgi:hypothetical protein